MFVLDEAAEKKIKNHYTTPKEIKCIEQDAFDSFLNDYCNESIERHKQEHSDKPWEACNLLPQKPPVDTEKQIQNTYIEIKEVLGSVPPTVVSGKHANCSLMTSFILVHQKNILQKLQKYYL